MFNIDFNKLITWIIPVPLRKKTFFAWMQTLCSPVVVLYDEFMAKRKADLYMLGHDSRVFSMEAVLNDRFDNINRRIYITDGFTKDRIYIFTPAEAKPLYLSAPVYLFNPADYGDTGIDFIVWVPTVVAMNAQGLIEMNALITTYKLAGKRYKIYSITL